MKDLILVRGIPGSGKSTLAQVISEANVAADDYFDEFNDGEFDPSQLKDAHKWCQDEVEDMMKHNLSTICVHNTFTEKWEMGAYYDLAKEYYYRVHTIIVENRHESESIHDVPKKTINKMKDRFDIVL